MVDPALSLNALARLLSTMNESAGIDTSAMVTMMSLLAAVWAVVPVTTRRRIQLSLTWVDYGIVLAAVVGIHVMFFEGPLRALHLYPVLGPWCWGFDKASTQYVLFLGPAAYLWLRTRRTRLNVRKLPLFSQLSTSLLHGRKFEELGELLRAHLKVVLHLATSAGLRGRLERALQPPWLPPYMDANGAFHVGEQSLSPVKRCTRKLRHWLATWVAPPKDVRGQAASIVRTVFSSRDFVEYMALAQPYFCIDVLQQTTDVVEQFQDEFFDALLNSEASVLYYELKGSENFETGRGSSRHLREESHLLRYYLVDVKVAEHLGVYRSVGESVLNRISTDESLRRRLNSKPGDRYSEQTRWRCPVHAGITFFDIMVLEGLHQRLGDHLWLHYMPHFAERLIEHADFPQEGDEDVEFPTQLYCLLFELVQVTARWITEAVYLVKPEAKLKADDTDGEHVCISFEAATAAGRILRAVMTSRHLTQRLRWSVLEHFLSCFRKLNSVPALAPLADALTKSLINPYSIGLDAGYLHQLRRAFADADISIKLHAAKFETELLVAEQSVAAKGN